MNKSVFYLFVGIVCILFALVELFTISTANVCFLVLSGLLNIFAANDFRNIAQAFDKLEQFDKTLGSVLPQC